MAKETIVIKSRHEGMGDYVCMTVLAREIQAQYPDRFDLWMNVRDDTLSEPGPRCLFENNPHVRGAGRRAIVGVKADLELDVGYSPVAVGKGRNRRFLPDYINWIQVSTQEPLHLLQAYVKDFQARSGLSLSLTAPHGDLHPTDMEKDNRLIRDRYWVIAPGGKTDMPSKVWDWGYYQEVVDSLLAKGLRVVQIGHRPRPGRRISYFNPALEGVIDLSGKTPSPRQVMHYVLHADGVIGHVSFPMHLAAALGRPCVVLAGGREPWWLTAYTRDNPALAGMDIPVPHRFLHTIGQLPCCARVGCFSGQVVSEADLLADIEGGTGTVDGGCANTVPAPRNEPLRVVPRCMGMIGPERAMAEVESYYEDGTLDPASRPARPSPIFLPPYTVLPRQRGDRSGSHLLPLDHPAIGGRIGIIAPPERIPLLMSNRFSDRLDPIEMGSAAFPTLESILDGPDLPWPWALCIDELLACTPDASWPLRLADAIGRESATGARLLGPTLPRVISDRRRDEYYGRQPWWNRSIHSRHFNARTKFHSYESLRFKCFAVHIPTLRALGPGAIEDIDLRMIHGGWRLAAWNRSGEYLSIRH